MFASVEGTAAIASVPQAFFAAFAERIKSGAIFGVRSRRSNYAVTRLAPDALEFRAADWPTALNIGLNEVDLTSSGGMLRYCIRYPRWSRYVVGLSAGIGVLLAIVLGALGVPGPMHGSAVLLWAMVIFWAFVWPWLLIAIHKIPLRRVITRLIAEVDASVSTGHSAA